MDMRPRSCALLRCVTSTTGEKIPVRPVPRAVFYAVLAATASRLAVRARAVGRHHRNDDLRLPLRRPWVLVSSRNGRAPSAGNCHRQLQVGANRSQRGVVVSLLDQPTHGRALRRIIEEGDDQTIEVKFVPDSSPFVRLPSRRVKTGRASLERARLTRVDARFLPNIPPLFFRASIPKLSICTPPPLSRRSGRSRAPSLVPHPTHHLFVPRPSSSAQAFEAAARASARTGTS